MTDIFDIVDDVAILIRQPFEDGNGNKFSGFSTYIEGQFVVYLNTMFSLGHERFTAAHELYHLMFDKEGLMREGLMFDEYSETKANLFAAEFLMPEDGVKEFFYKRLTSPIEEKHIVRIQQHFKVSYSAMLRRLKELQLISEGEYEKLKEISKPEYAEQLKKLTIQEGYTLELILPSYKKTIPERFFEMIIDNYVQGRISYSKFSTFLSFVGKTPLEMGYEPPEV
ncbi:Zn-dependent peptidase ImmA (M78 family) [Anoxybacillus tepidamans]|uniref:Zn-dependent peptidase ImmA (M78 family) n=1 Tax=Anoxybacteroides tepidamans TaxID=265948 RepID=A0A7W8MUY6_9BACL|nr:Zn-dependent peptidase ImmA (M78 family) [Anoxybacillus tepidamans]